MTLQALADLRQQQAASLAYFDVFWVCAAVGLALVILVLLMKRSVAEKGTHVGAERSRNRGQSGSRRSVSG
jgi:DHA2 family multidrug resistance protein